MRVRVHGRFPGETGGYAGHAGADGIHIAPGGRRGAQGRPDKRGSRGADFSEKVRAKTKTDPHLSTERGGCPHGRSDGPIFGPGRGSPGDSGPTSPTPAPPDPVPRAWAGRGPGGTPGGRGKGMGITMSQQRGGKGSFLAPSPFESLSRALSLSLSVSRACALRRCSVPSCRGPRLERRER